MKKIKILMVDDHQLIVDGMISLLKNKEDILVAGVANNGKEALQMLRILEPDLVIMDIDMPVMNGIDALREIKKTNPGTRVIILSMHEEAGMIKNLVALGADGYLLKSCSEEELFRAINTVALGQPYFSHGVTVSLLNAKVSAAPSSDPLHEVLSDRETEVLRLITEGFSNKEIGAQLYISHRTVDTHRTNLMKKLNVSNIAGLISYAIRNGLA
jgi:DNA-binding NarL/FixJ family response regulator